MPASPLDDRALVLRNDPKGMYDLTCAFGDQCREARRIASAVEFRAPRPTVALLTGMGGSAAGGDFARAIFEAQGSVPFAVNRDYALPHCAGPETLVFAASYSGNTEETLSAYDDGTRKGCGIVAVCSGGELAKRAEADGHPIVRIPSGMPPRTALGYLAVPVLFASEAMGLIPAQPYDKAFELLDSCTQDWGIETPAASNTAKQIAEALHGAVGVLYGLGGWQGIVAGRWKGQINENAKNMAFANSFPELNHNEILGWVGAKGQGVAQWTAVILEDGTESAKMQARARVTSELIAGRAKVMRATARGVSLLEKLLSLTLLGDFVSLYLATLNEVDPETIDSINTLKAELAKVHS